MKKLLFICGLMTCLMLGEITTSWAAPVFSSSLAGGGATYRSGTRKSVYTSGKSQKKKRPLVATHKFVLRYEPGQVTLSKKQQEDLIPILQRIQSGKTRRLEVVGIAHHFNTVTARQRVIGRLIQAYAPQFAPHYRHITGNAVFDSNRDTMELIEY